MTKQEAEEAVMHYGSQRKAAKALGIHHKNLWNVLNGKKSNRKKAAAAPAQPATATAKTCDIGKGRSLADFLKAHDKATIIPAKIREALKKLGKGGWLYESEFVKLANVSPCDFSAYRDEFAAYFVQLRDRRAWAGSEKLANQMKEVL